MAELDSELSFKWPSRRLAMLTPLLIARPDRHSDDAGEGDAIEVAAKLRSIRAGSSTE